MLSPNCVTSDSALSFAPHVQPSPGRVRSAAQLGNGSGSLPFHPPLGPEPAQGRVNTCLAQGYSPASRPTSRHPALLSKGPCPLLAQAGSALGSETSTGAHSLGNKIQMAQPAIRGSSSDLPLQSCLALDSLQAPRGLSHPNVPPGPVFACAGAPARDATAPNLFPETLQNVTQMPPPSWPSPSHRPRTMSPVPGSLALGTPVAGTQPPTVGPCCLGWDSLRHRQSTLTFRDGLVPVLGSAETGRSVRGGGGGAHRGPRKASFAKA